MSRREHKATVSQRRDIPQEHWRKVCRQAGCLCPSEGNKVKPQREIRMKAFGKMVTSEAVARVGDDQRRGCR